MISDPKFKEKAEYVYNTNWSASGPFVCLYDAKKTFKFSAIAGAIGSIAITSKFHPIRLIGKCSLIGSAVSASLGTVYLKIGVDGYNEITSMIRDNPFSLVNNQNSS
ncbi:MAG: hypothetical protein H0V82_11040 [Candidatus Protochlamydia sp.]|nr:hypothetical protein [Candidatus Protochlamydia sp.]